MQILVGRRRPFGTPLPTRPCIIHVSFTEWLDLSVTRLTRWYLFKKSHAVWKCSFPNIQNTAEWSYGSTWWLPRRGSRINFRTESLARQLFSVHRFIFPWYFHIALHFGELSWKINVSLYRCPPQHFHTFYSTLPTREHLGSQSLVNLFRNSLTQTILNSWNLT